MHIAPANNLGQLCAANDLPGIEQLFLTPNALPMSPLSVVTWSNSVPSLKHVLSFSPSSPYFRTPSNPLLQRTWQKDDLVKALCTATELGNLDNIKLLVEHGTAFAFFRII